MYKKEKQKEVKEEKEENISHGADKKIHKNSREENKKQNRKIGLVLNRTSHPFRKIKPNVVEKIFPTFQMIKKAQKQLYNVEIIKSFKKEI